MVQEKFAPGESVEKTPGGYCLQGKAIKFLYGASSQQFSDHVDFCNPCNTALTREQNAMEREMGNARKDGKV